LREHWAVATLVAVVIASTVWSGIAPADYGTWLFELIIGFAGVVVLLAIYRRFRFSNVAYVILAVHYLVLAAGAKYTYSNEPLFNWLRDALSLSRNHFDRVGHFMQGVTPALLSRELLLRTTALGRGKWLSTICVSIALAVSAFYELLEWWMVIIYYPGGGPEWLGMQGDPWDAQGDMLMALLGAIAVVLFFSRPHDRSIETLQSAGRGSAD
jgi:putative membrane protein